jgi:acyl carrier protein
MKMTSDSLIPLLYECIDEFNELNDEEMHLSKEPTEILFGKEGKLDSLDLVNLVVMIEEKLEDDLDISVSIASDKAMSQKRSPFRDIQSLADFLVMLIADLEHE